MTNDVRHRLARLMRISTAWAVAFHGFIFPWATGPLYAKNPDTMTIGVRAVSTSPPDRVTDLVASPNLAVEGQVSLTWTAPQGNAGGVPISSQPVAAYLIRYATFSVADLLGDTTAWWNASVSNQQFLQAPTNTPKDPGQLEASSLSSLTPGGTYYFGIKSISMGGITSPIDTLSESPLLQAWAVTTIFPPPVGLPPKRPNGLSASFFGGQFTLNWRAVTQDTSHQAIGIDHYSVYRYDAINSTPTLVGTLGAGTQTFTETVGSSVYFYRVLAVSLGGVSSAASDYIDSSSNLNRVVVAPSDPNSRITLPMSVALELNAETNGSGDDYEVVALRQTQNENEITLKSYLFEVQNVRTGLAVSGFSFSQAVAEVQVSYALSFPTLGLNAQLSGGQDSISQAQAIAQLISLYWYNGAGFVRLGGTVLVSSQALMITARNMGLYEVRAVSMPTSFALTRNSPYPRVITPNHPSQNNRVFWFFDNPTAESVSGTIYDIRGAKVRDIQVDSLSPTPNSLVWDGRDMNGAVVPSGVYLYKIAAGKESATGSIVVAR